MKRLITIGLLLICSCSEAPYQPAPLTKDEIIDSLKTELARKKLVAARRAYIIQCNREWFRANGIEPPCKGNP